MTAWAGPDQKPRVKKTPYIWVPLRRIMKRSPRVRGVGRTNRPSPRYGAAADAVKGFGDVSIVNVESQATEINLNASTSSLEHPGKTSGPVMHVIAGSASSVSPRVFEAMRTAPRRRDFIATTRPLREGGPSTLAPAPPSSSRASSRAPRPPPEPEPEPAAAAAAAPSPPETPAPPPPPLAPLRAHAYEEKVAGKSVVTGHDTNRKLKKLVPEVERKGPLQDFEKKKHVLEVISELQVARSPALRVLSAPPHTRAAPASGWPARRVGSTFHAHMHAASPLISPRCARLPTCSTSSTRSLRGRTRRTRSSTSTATVI
jgi:hypothetical protein